MYITRSPYTLNEACAIWLQFFSKIYSSDQGQRTRWGSKVRQRVEVLSFSNIIDPLHNNNNYVSTREHSVCALRIYIAQMFFSLSRPSIANLTWVNNPNSYINTRTPISYTLIHQQMKVNYRQRGSWLITLGGSLYIKYLTSLSKQKSTADIEVIKSSSWPHSSNNQTIEYSGCVTTTIDLTCFLLTFNLRGLWDWDVTLSLLTRRN